MDPFYIGCGVVTIIFVGSSILLLKEFYNTDKQANNLKNNFADRDTSYYHTGGDGGSFLGNNDFIDIGSDGCDSGDGGGE